MTATLSMITRVTENGRGRGFANIACDREGLGSGENVIVQSAEREWVDQEGERAFLGLGCCRQKSSAERALIWPSGIKENGSYPKNNNP